MAVCYIYPAGILIGGQLMMRRLLKGALAALATIAVIYAFGTFGLLFERLTGRSEPGSALAIIGLIVAGSIGALFLRHLSRRTDASNSEEIG